MSTLIGACSFIPDRSLNWSEFFPVVLGAFEYGCICIWYKNTKNGSWRHTFCLYRSVHIVAISCCFPVFWSSGGMLNWTVNSWFNFPRNSMKFWGGRSRWSISDWGVWHWLLRIVLWQQWAIWQCVPYFFSILPLQKTCILGFISIVDHYFIAVFRFLIFYPFWFVSYNPGSRPNKIEFFLSA